MMFVDFHTHILPQMDDGSRSVAESLQMLKMAQEQGVEEIVASPHFYPHNETPDQFLIRRAAAMERLAMKVPEGYPKVYLGAEVYYYPGMSESDALKELTIDGGKGILVEMPMAPWTDRMFQELEGIHEKLGLIPIVAHMERYLSFWHNRKLPERLAELPVLVQVNAKIFLNYHTSKIAMKLLKKGQIHLLGSDCHNLQNRAPNLGKAAARIEDTLDKDCLDQVSYYQSLILEKAL